MKEYYIHIGQQEGPFTIEQLRSKNLSKDTPVWFEGLNEWVTAREIPELQSIARSVPPPFQSEAQKEYEYQIAMEEYFPEKRKISWTTIFLVTFIAGAFALLVWLMKN